MLGQWIEESCIQRWVGTVPPSMTKAHVDCHLVHMAVVDHTDSSTVFSWSWSNAVGLELSSSIVCCQLLRALVVAYMPFHRLLMSRNHQCLRLQWACKFYYWHAQWLHIVFSEESQFILFWNGHICDRWYHSEHNLTACIAEWRTRQKPSVTVQGTIWYNMWHLLLCIQGNLSNNHYNKEFLEL